MSNLKEWVDLVGGKGKKQGQRGPVLKKALQRCQDLLSKNDFSQGQGEAKKTKRYGSETWDLRATITN